MREQLWSSRIRGCSLVAELEVKERHGRQVAEALGRVYDKWAALGRAEGVFTRWPACVAVALTGIAAREYRQGELWPELWRGLGYEGEQHDRVAWGRGFLTAVHGLGLPEFAEMPLPYVGPILMHTGIPDYCLDDYFLLVSQRRTADPELDPEGFLDWATARPNRLNTLDVPARRFLEYGTDYALDFLDRTFDLLDRLRDPTPDFDGVGLPERVMLRAQELVSSGSLSPRPRRTGVSDRGHAERPRISLDPFGRGIEVVVPAAGETSAGIARWTVTADGSTTTIRSQAHWPGAAESAPPTAFTLLQPVRTVVVSRDDWTHQTELTVVDANAPLLVFADDGRRLAANMPLPPDDVWVAYPDEHELIVDGEFEVTIEGQLPLGWIGWRLRRIRLAGARSLELAGCAATRRFVRGHARPRIDSGRPIPGVTSPFGTPVHAEVPTIWLPGQAGAQTKWTVEIRQNGGDTAIVSDTYTIEEPQTVTALWDALPSPVLGSFDIIVRGPLGRGLTRTLYVAEGLSTRFLPPVRVFDGTHLVRGRAELTVRVGAQVEPRDLDFGQGVRASVVEYRTQTETEPLIITPPHLQVMHERVDLPLVWSAGLLRISAEVFADDPGVLLVQVPEATELPPLQVVVRDRILQTVPPSGRAQAGTARYALTRIADTVAEYHGVELVLETGGVPVRLATVRPRRLAKGVEREGDHLRLVEHAPIEGLTAGIYATTAPWRGPEVAPVAADGTVALPSELRHAGPLLVLLRVEDPWVPADWPSWPKGSILVTGDGHFTGDDPEEAALSRFVAGVGEFPAQVDDLRRVWTLVHLAPQTRSAREARGFQEACAHPLRCCTIDAIKALADLGLTPSQTVVAVISAGLTATSVPGRTHADTARRLWPIAPLLGGLVGALADLDCRDTATRQCGDTVDAIIDTGTDPHAHVGRFGRETVMMIDMSPQQIEGLWRAAQIVPHALLDADSRAVAARRLFDRRDKSYVKNAGRSAAPWVQSLLRLVADRPVLRSQIEARRPPPGLDGLWAIPAASAAFAIVARLAARGDQACQDVERGFRATWALLAEGAPDLVVIDLVLAELLITHEETATP